MLEELLNDLDDAPAAKRPASKYALAPCGWGLQHSLQTCMITRPPTRLSYITARVTPLLCQVTVGSIASYAP